MLNSDFAGAHRKHPLVWESWYPMGLRELSSVINFTKAGFEPTNRKDSAEEVAAYGQLVIYQGASLFVSPDEAIIGEMRCVDSVAEEEEKTKRRRSNRGDCCRRIFAEGSEIGGCTERKLSPKGACRKLVCGVGRWLKKQYCRHRLSRAWNRLPLLLLS